jgi:hypothetical protein
MHNEDTMSDERYAEYLEGGSLQGELDDGARGELDELRGVLAKPHAWGEPPPALADDIVALIRAEAAARDRAEPVEAQPAAPISQQPARRRAWLRPALAVAAAAIVGLALGAVIAGRDSGPGGESFALAATDVIPGVSGEATVAETGSGLSISLSIENLPPAEPGTFYQAWMRGETGSVPIGTFHARGNDDGRIELWSGVDVADYPLMTVTIQQEGAGPESSGVVVLRGEIPQP